MPAPTDLTWEQFQQAYFNARSGTEVSCFEIRPVDPTNPNNGQYIFLNLGFLTDTTFNSLADTGVIKALTIALELARNAQETLNQGKPPVDRLNAFPASTVGGASNGLVPVARSVVAKYELASATKIIG